MKLPPKSTVIRTFRALAVAEGFSWAALLVGMFLKWVLRTTELGVEIAGPVHGAFFIGYGLAALALWRLQRWPFRVAVLAGLSAVLPFATVWFERWAGRRGYLAEQYQSRQDQAGQDGAAAPDRAGPDDYQSGQDGAAAPYRAGETARF